jgi:hypothetical protein
MEIKVIYFGEDINSPYPYKRFKNFIIWKDGRALTNEAEIDALRNEIKHRLWSESSLGIKPWWEYQRCKYCYERFQYVHQKKLMNEHVWNRVTCLRHYFIEHLYELDATATNRTRALVIQDGTAYAIVESTNYRYNIDIDNEKAIMRVRYKGRDYVFTYRNHSNAFPYLSSYQMLKFIIYQKFNEILLEARTKINEECVSWSNYVINFKLIPACPSENK